MELSTGERRKMPSFEILTDATSSLSSVTQSCSPEELCNPELGFDCSPEADDNLGGRLD